MILIFLVFKIVVICTVSGFGDGLVPRVGDEGVSEDRRATEGHDPESVDVAACSHQSFDPLI